MKVVFKETPIGYKLKESPGNTGNNLFNKALNVLDFFSGVVLKDSWEDFIALLPEGCEVEVQ